MIFRIVSRMYGCNEISIYLCTFCMEFLYGNKVVDINNITYDKKVFYSTLYKESKQGKIKDKILKIKEKDKSKKHDKLTNLDQMLMDFNNGVVDYIDIVIFLEQYDIILDYSDLFTELIPTDGVIDDRTFTTLTS